MVGPYNPGVGAQTLPLYIAAGIVPIRLTSADSTNGLGLTLQPMTCQIVPVASDALSTWLKAKSVAIVYDDTTLYTKTVSSALKSELQSANVTLRAFEPIQPGAKTYASTIQKVAGTNPDVVYLATYSPEGGLIAKEMFAAKAKPKCVADYGAHATGFVEVAGRKAAPGAWSPYTYDSVGFLADGVKQAGGFDPTKLSAALTKLTGLPGGRVR